MTRPPRRWVSALGAAYERLALLVNALGPDDLSLPSYEKGQTIAQMLAHLGTGAATGLAAIEAAASGRPPPRPGELEAIRDVWARRAPEHLASEMLAINKQYIQFLENMADDELAAFRMFLYIRNVDIISVLRPRLGELAIHAWDIQTMSEPAVLVDAEAVDFLVRDLAALPPWFGKPQGRTFRVQVTSENPECHYVIGVSQRVTVMSGKSAGDVDGHLTMPAEALVRLVFARLDPERTPEVKMVGKVALDDVRAIFSGR
jgi:uncharacterized protein (TIGR03083 family)